MHLDLAQQNLVKAESGINRNAREVEPRIKSQLTLTTRLNRLRMGTGGFSKRTPRKNNFQCFKLHTYCRGGVDVKHNKKAPAAKPRLICEFRR